MEWKDAQHGSHQKEAEKASERGMTLDWWLITIHHDMTGSPTRHTPWLWDISSQATISSRASSLNLRRGHFKPKLCHFSTLFQSHFTILYSNLPKHFLLYLIAFLRILQSIYFWHKFLILKHVCYAQTQLFELPSHCYHKFSLSLQIQILLCFILR